MASAIVAGQVGIPVSPVTRTPNKVKPITRIADQDFSDIFFSFFKGQVIDIAKGVGYATFWITKALHPLPYQYREFGKLMRDVKNFISFTEIPEKLTKVVKSVKEFFENPSIPAGCTAVKENMGLANSLLDSIELIGTRKIFRIGKEPLIYFEAANHGAILVGSGISAYENVDKIDQAAPDESAKAGLYLINLARDVSYVVFGAFGLFCFFAGFAAAPFYPVVMVACLTTALTFSIGGYFYERIINPEENPNYFDPNKMQISIQNRNLRMSELLLENGRLETSILNRDQRMSELLLENGRLETSMLNRAQRIQELEQENVVLESRVRHRNSVIQNLNQINIDLRQRQMNLP